MSGTIPRPRRPRLRLEVLESRTAPAAGLLDTAFNGTGLQLDQATGVVLGNGGKIIVGGWVQLPSGASAFGVARLNGNGSLDSTFGQQGMQVLGFNLGFATTAAATGIALQPDG